jgi:putative pyruvate formate lyase activating enzyme
MDTSLKNDIFERAREARGALVNCHLCPRECAVNRTAGEKGHCRLDDLVRCFREILYYGEESELVPSYQIHMAGCNLNCAYCLVAEWNETPSAAEPMNFDSMAERIAVRQRQGAKTLNLLGGEPAVNVHGVLELLTRVDSAIKVVWNSNMYYNDIVDRLLAGLVDIYLADFKCGNNKCAKALLGADNYVEVVKHNIVQAAGHAGVIVRHVVLPGHRDCCLEPILQWLATEGPDVKLSLRDNYIPPVPQNLAPKKYLEADEMQRAVETANRMGLKLIR